MTDPSRCFALIPAGGTGMRAGAAIPKQYLSIAGRPMIVHTLAAFAAVPAIERIVVVVAPDDARFETLELDPGIARRVEVVRVGGATRDASVANGLAASMARDDDWVLVHDAARCGITSSLISTLISTLTAAQTERATGDAVGGLLAVTLDDTVKREATDVARLTSETVDRRGLWRAQTPQMFRSRMLAEALVAARASGVTITDESSAIEAAGHRVLLVPGSPRNFKVTTPDDLALMDLLLRAASRSDEPKRPDR